MPSWTQSGPTVSSPFVLQNRATNRLLPQAKRRPERARASFPCEASALKTGSPSSFLCLAFVDALQRRGKEVDFQYRAAECSCLYDVVCV